MQKRISIIFMLLPIALMAGCTTKNTTADIIDGNEWDELRCAQEGGLVVEGEPLKCRISKEFENGDIETKEIILGEENADEILQEYKPQLADFIKRSNMPIKNIWMIENPVMGKEGAVVLMNGDYVQLYMFETEDEAFLVNKALQEEKALPDGTDIEWGEDAVFFRLGGTVAVMNGENTNVFLEEDRQ